MGELPLEKLYGLTYIIGRTSAYSYTSSNKNNLVLKHCLKEQPTLSKAHASLAHSLTEVDNTQEYHLNGSPGFKALEAVGWTWRINRPVLNQTRDKKHEASKAKVKLSRG